MRGKHNNHAKGSRNGRWTGGVISDGHGRVVVYSPQHPYPNHCGTHVYRYRLVMEKHLGRFLLPTEIVHHKNGIVSDDRLENLEMMSQSDHLKSHLPKMRLAMKKKWEGKWSKHFSACKQCSTTARKHMGLGLCSRCYKRNRKAKLLCNE